MKRTHASTAFVLPQEKMTEEEKRNFEAKIEDFIYETGKFVAMTSTADGQ